MKYIVHLSFLIFFALCTIPAAFSQGDAPTLVQGQGATAKSVGATIQVPHKTATKVNASTTVIETGNTNLLENPSFNAAVVSNTTAGWTVTSTGTATCTISISTSSPMDGQKQYLLLEASGGASGGTCSIKQEPTTTRSTDALVGFSYLSDPLGTCPGGHPTIEIRTLVNGSSVTSQDATNCGTSSSWQPFYVNEVTGTTSTGVEAVITVPASTASDISLDAAKVSPGEIPMASIITQWAAYTPTLTGFGTATSVSMEWRQVGSNIEIRGDFVAGTTTATEARMTLPNNYTSSTPGTQVVGFWGRGASASGHGSFIRIAPSSNYIVFTNDAFSGATVNALSVANGNGMVASGNTVTINVSIPVNELSGTTQILNSQCGAKCSPVLSAKVSSADAVTDENHPWINGNCTDADTGEATCSFDAGIFTEAPHCFITFERGANEIAPTIVSVSSTSITFKGWAGGSAVQTNAFLLCVKSDADTAISNAIAASLLNVMTAPGITKPKTCYAAFGGASATLASPTECTTGTCIEVQDTCGTFSPPAFSSTGLYTNATFAAGTFSSSSYIQCSCTALDTTTTEGSDCDFYWETGDNNWSTSSSGGFVSNVQATTQTGTAANKYVQIECTGQAP